MIDGAEDSGGFTQTTLFFTEIMVVTEALEWLRKK